jgi:N,N'-diacetyllegionaminate synthase
MPELIAELSTNHGGDVGLAEAMIAAAIEAGAHTVKTQAYTKDHLNLYDPQAAWLIQSRLNHSAHVRLKWLAEGCGANYLSTPFDADSLEMLRGLGLKRFKIASSESANRWWDIRDGEQWLVSYPWGRRPDKNGLACVPHPQITPLATIPLYPTPLEAVGRMDRLSGYSDHTEGLAACYSALALGAKVLEVHLKLPGRGRECSWDKTPEDIKRLRDFAEDVTTMQSGVARKFRERWQG